MIWQDIVIAGGQVLFIFALLPSVRGTQKPDWRTSLITAVVLTVFAPTFWTLNLIWGAVTVGVAALLWWVLFWQARN